MYVVKILALIALKFVGFFVMEMVSEFTFYLYFIF